MSVQINKVILLGNLGREPDARESAGGLMVRLSVGTSRKYKDRDGNRQEETEWTSVMIFGKTAEIAKTYLHKGSEVYIEGRLKTRKYKAQDGSDRWATDVICETLTLGSRPKTEAEPAPAPAQKLASGNYDDIPF